jgi:hypothetical protein
MIAVEVAGVVVRSGGAGHEFSGPRHRSQFPRCWGALQWGTVQLSIMGASVQLSSCCRRWAGGSVGGSLRGIAPKRLNNWRSVGGHSDVVTYLPIAAFGPNGTCSASAVRETRFAVLDQLEPRQLAQADIEHRG